MNCLEIQELISKYIPQKFNFKCDPNTHTLLCKDVSFTYSQEPSQKKDKSFSIYSSYPATDLEDKKNILKLNNVDYDKDLEDINKEFVKNNNLHISYFSLKCVNETCTVKYIFECKVNNFFDKIYTKIRDK